ncbi:hypothetical protein B0T17DRAFT_521223 [Bombardia bombarda]|uniref:Uncharacterized protein n=1 Tax=Bombardia bombarda TaxID=252184 RepID=A0AA39XNH2_9PEZI|nr:hypothetical protein B0T17DRAFT_521223 [Bombardia bombarda]
MYRVAKQARDSVVPPVLPPIGAPQQPDTRVDGRHEEQPLPLSHLAFGSPETPYRAASQQQTIEQGFSIPEG